MLFETKKEYAKEMATGFIRLNGMTIGAVANRSKVYDAEGNAESFDAVLTVDGCKKATDFINFCDAFDIPVLSLTNVKGYKTCMCAEKNLAKAMARLTYAFANATVPKVNVIIGQAYGTAYVAMNSKAIGADITMAWPNAEIGTMDSKLAAKIMYADSDAATINESTNIVEDLGADSLEIVDMLMALEENFGITVSDEEALTLKTVKDVAEFIERKV